jgi:dihydrofolate reductase
MPGVGKLIEVNHVSLGGEIGSPERWAFPYLNEEHGAYSSQILQAAEALLLGRRTYEGLSAGYTSMPSNPFVDRMNSIRKYVATSTLRELEWNAEVIVGDIPSFVLDLKSRSTGTILKYGNGQLDIPLIENGLIDEFHILLTPVAIGTGKHLFEFEIPGGPPNLRLLRTDAFTNGVILLVYGP